MPLFFVSKVMQGSSCPSQRGAAGLVKSLDHDSADATGSWTCGEDCVGVRMNVGEYVLAEVEALMLDGDSSATSNRG